MLSTIKTKRTAATLIVAAFILLIVAIIQLANPTGSFAEMANANRTATAISRRPRATARPAATEAPRAVKTVQATAALVTSILAATDQPHPTEDRSPPAESAPPAPMPTISDPIESLPHPVPGKQTAVAVPTEDTASYPAPPAAQPAPTDDAYPAPATTEPVKAPATATADASIAATSVAATSVPIQPTTATATNEPTSTATAPTDTPSVSIQAAAKAAGEPLFGTSCSSEGETSSISLDWVLNWEHVVSASATVTYPDGNQKVVDVTPGWSISGVISISFSIRWDDGTTASAAASCAAGQPPTATPSATRTPRPTRTATPTASPGSSPTPQPTATARPTKTPTPTGWPTATPQPTRTPTPIAASTPTAIPNAIKCTCSYYSDTYSIYRVFVLDRGMTASSTARIYYVDGTAGSEHFSDLIKTFSGAIARVDVNTTWPDGAWARGSVSCAAVQLPSTPTNTVAPTSTDAPKPTDTAAPTSTSTPAHTATPTNMATPVNAPTPIPTSAPTKTVAPHAETPIVASEQQTATPTSSPTPPPMLLPAAAPISISLPAVTATPGKIPGASDYSPPEPNPSHEPPTSTRAPTATATAIPQFTERAKPPPNHIGNIRLEQTASEFTAPEITADLRNLTIDGKRINITDEQGNQIPLIFYIQPRVWQSGDNISPVLEAKSKAESRIHPGVAIFRSSDGTGHDSIIQRGNDRIIELHSWRARNPDGRIILEPGEVFKLILDGPDLMIHENGKLYAVASRTPEERQHVIEQLTGQTFLLSQPNGKGGIVRQPVRIKWIYTPSPPTVSTYYREQAMTVRQMIEGDFGIIPKQQQGEQWLQLCTLRTAGQPRETYGRGGAGYKARLIDHEQTLTSISIIPV
jgi:hypothetical protein